MPKIIRDFLINLLLSAGAVLLMSAAAEAFFRMNPRFGYLFEGIQPVHSAPMLTKFPSHCLRPSDTFGYENIPGCTITEYEPPRRINRYGMVGTEYPLKKTARTYRILLLGDSVAWFDWSRQFLEEMLNSDPRLNKQYQFEIFNAGTPSYDVRRYALYLQKKGFSFHPDMVLIYLFMNDFNADMNFYYKTASGNEAFYAPLPLVRRYVTVNTFFLQHSYAYRFVLLHAESYLWIKTHGLGVDAKDPVAVGTRYVSQIKHMCEARGIPLEIVVCPYLKPLDDYDPDQRMSYDTILRVLAATGCHNLNLYPQLIQKGIVSLRLSPTDEIHPTREGHRLYAQFIYQDLIQNYFSNR